MPAAVPTRDGPVGGADRARRPSFVGLGDDLAGGSAPRAATSSTPHTCASGGARSARLGQALRGLRPPRRDPPDRLGHQAPAAAAALAPRGRGGPAPGGRGGARPLRASRSPRCCRGCAPRSCTTTWRRPTCCVDDRLAVTGITDFGDMTHTALVCDLAVAAADVLSGREDAPRAGARGGRGLPLRHPARAARSSPSSPDLMAGRYAAAVLITAWRTREQGWAPEIDDEAHAQLEAMLAAGLDPLRRRGAAPPPVAARGPTASPGRAPAPARSGGQELSYDRPLHLVSGRGRGARGRRRPALPRRLQQRARARALAPGRGRRR